MYFSSDSDVLVPSVAVIGTIPSYRCQLYLITYIPSCSISRRRYGLMCLCFLTKSTDFQVGFLDNALV